MPSHPNVLLHPRQSVRRLRTVFESLSQGTRSRTPVTVSSPLSASASDSSRFSAFSFGDFSNHSTSSLAGAPGLRQAIRRKKSVMEMEREEERHFDGALVDLIEPRPCAGPTLGGIEEVLDGRV